jgi:hypothetical protein
LELRDPLVRLVDQRLEPGGPRVELRADLPGHFRQVHQQVLHLPLDGPLLRHARLRRRALQRVALALEHRPQHDVRQCQRPHADQRQVALVREGCLKQQQHARGIRSRCPGHLQRNATQNPARAPT